LRPSAYDLLGDSESFLEDLSDNDLATINGGGFWDRLLDAVVSALVGFGIEELLR